MTRVDQGTDPVGLSWLVTVRWTTLLAFAGAALGGRSAVQVSVPMGMTFTALAVCALTNVWLVWRVRRRPTATLKTVAGGLVCLDVVVLSVLLLSTGGVLNPASVFYLVEIVVVALVLGRVWTWGVTALSVAGYAALFLAPTDELRAAQVMHPEIGLHMRGMWLAFASTALVVAALVTRLAIAIERRDRAIEQFRERTARTTRLAGLATLAAGAAHELSTPLSTIAVAARELEHRVSDGALSPGLQEDARLIRREADRCRRILEAMAAHGGGSAGEAPRTATMAEVIARVRAKLDDREWARVDVAIEPLPTLLWPIDVIATGLANLVRNGLQASGEAGRVLLRACRAAGAEVIQLDVIDRGAGMAAAELARAGEPFFTTKPAGRGTGLGLFVTRTSLEPLDGVLMLRSSPGEGTTATITLPANVLPPGAGDRRGV